MRLTTVNPLPFAPRTPIERQLCDKVQAASGEVVLNVWTPDTYPFTDAEDNVVVLDADFEVKTGRLTNGLFVSGSVYRGFFREGELHIEFYGAWI